MRTRCPVCNTVFRVTSEQLRVKAGKVRCGHCQSLFNAFDSLVDDKVDPAPPPLVDSAASTSPPVFEPEPPTPAFPAAEISAPAAIAPSAPAVEKDPLPTPEPEPPQQAVDEPAALPPEAALPTEAVSPAVAPQTSDSNTDAEPVPGEAAAADRAETVEQSTLAAREAGLVAVRELSDTPAYNRWAAGALSADTGGGFASEAVAPARWPFTLSVVVLLLGLVIQLAHHFRSDLVLRLPQTAGLFAAAAVDVPLPRKADLVGIESSDLQSDNARGLLVLQATLRNRAAFAQAWPDLELTLTDTRDSVVSRRILAATDYLPPGTNPQAFAANGEIAVRLWIEAKDLGAAGYRLYLFYP